LFRSVRHDASARPDCSTSGDAGPGAWRRTHGGSSAARRDTASDRIGIGSGRSE
jgi:hypothetical protein